MFIKFTYPLVNDVYAHFNFEKFSIDAGFSAKLITLGKRQNVSPQRFILEFAPFRSSVGMLYATGFSHCL